jgi:hypothetical protein
MATGCIQTGWHCASRPRCINCAVQCCSAHATPRSTCSSSSSSVECALENALAGDLGDALRLQEVAPEAHRHAHELSLTAQLVNITQKDDLWAYAEAAAAVATVGREQGDSGMLSIPQLARAQGPQRVSCVLLIHCTAYKLARVTRTRLLLLLHALVCLHPQRAAGHCHRATCARSTNARARLQQQAQRIECMNVTFPGSRTGLAANGAPAGRRRRRL